MSVVVLLAAVPAGWAQTASLAETVKAGDCFRYRLEMKLSGAMKVHSDGKAVPIKLTATASHAFPERVLAVNKDGLPERVARVYESAKAVIVAGKDRSERALRDKRRLIVAQRHKEQALVYSPAGALYRSELELTSEHFDTLCLTGLLPGKDVKVGETWKVGPGVVQALCAFEYLEKHALTGKLEGVAGGVATLSVSGTATGLELGAVVKAKVEATGKFDLKAKRLVALEWKQQDERDQGPASPASTTAATVTVSRSAVEQPAALSDVALISVPAGLAPPAALTYVEQRDPKGRFALLHGREWVLVSETDEHTVLRLMDKGDFVAQVTVTSWTKAKKGEHLSPVAFKAAMDETTGWRPERELQAGEVPSADGRWVYRLSVLGELHGVAVLQNFYLVAAPGGEQVVLAFTLAPKQADKLGARDLSLAGSIEVPAAK
jgi:hypothetical protein